MSKVKKGIYWISYVVPEKEGYGSQELYVYTPQDYEVFKARTKLEVAKKCGTDNFVIIAWSKVA